MLPSKNRLNRKKDFDLAYRLGASFSSGIIFLKARKNKTEAIRFGFPISLKFSKKAVLRNKIRRKLREIAQKNLGKIKTGFDLVVSIRKKEGSEISIKELEKDFLKALKKSGLA